MSVVKNFHQMSATLQLYPNLQTSKVSVHSVILEGRGSCMRFILHLKDSETEKPENGDLPRFC